MEGNEGDEIWMTVDGGGNGEWENDGEEGECRERWGRMGCYMFILMGSRARK